jgi:hypothetical protein
LEIGGQAELRNIARSDERHSTDLIGVH